MAAPKLSTVYSDRLALLDAAIADLDGGAGSVTVLGVTYTSAQTNTLETVRELTSVKGAIARIQDGGQAFQHGDGRALTEADLPRLYERRDELTGRLGAATRGGIPVTLGVPLG